MSYVIQAVLSNAQHPEYGQVTIGGSLARQPSPTEIKKNSPVRGSICR